MPLPRLLHSVVIEIQQIDRTGTFQDDDAREPVQIVKRNITKQLPGQVKWGSQYNLEPTKVGPTENSDGYVLFRKVDLDSQSITLKSQDRIIKMGHVETDVYIVNFEWIGHYTDQVGPTMLKAYFIDRQPSKQTRGV